MFPAQRHLAPHPPHPHPSADSPGGSGLVGVPSDSSPPHGPCGPLPPLPTATNPLGRLNLLLSTAPWQSDTWSTCLPRLLEPMGVYAHRAATARESERLIKSTTIHIAVIDLSIPLDRSHPGQPVEPAGARVLDLLSRLDAPPPTVIIKAPRAMRDERRDLHEALRCGAFAVVDRAAADLEMMLNVMQRCLTRFYAGRWPEPPSPPSPPSPPTNPPTTWV